MVPTTKMLSTLHIWLCLLTLSALSITTSATPASRALAQAAPFPFEFTELFTVTLNVGKILKPLDIPGGVLISEPIKGGIVVGPYINGTIQGGFAHPSVYGNGKLQVPTIDVYGMTSDGQSFYIHEEGIGLGSSQVTRIVKTSSLSDVRV